MVKRDTEMKGVSLVYELKSEAGQDRSAGLLAKATQAFCTELRMFQVS